MFIFEISQDMNFVYFVEVVGLPDYLEFISRYFAPLLPMIEKGES